MEAADKLSRKKLYNIHCPSCGAPANYDIKSRMYKCQYCGGSVGVGEALDKHMGFRSICREKMNAAIKNYELEKASCTGCGAELIFDKGDAVANCAFCGRTLVREAYVKPDNIPELIIPFSITNEEAQEILTDWCKKNASKKEAKGLLTTYHPKVIWQRLTARPVRSAYVRSRIRITTFCLGGLRRYLQRLSEPVQ